LRFKIFIIFILIPLIISGCTGSRELNKTTFTNPEELKNYFKQRDNAISTLSGSGSLTIETPEAAHNASFEVKLKKPDSLLIELSGPFGISVGTLMLSRQSFIFYNSLENKILKGASDINSLKPIVNLELSFDDVLNIFTGSYLYSSIDYVNADFSSSGNQYIIRNGNSPIMKELIIDNENVDALKYSEIGSDHRLRMDIEAKRYDIVNGVSIPFWFRLLLPKERKAFTLVFDEIVINKPVVCSFQIPDGMDTN
jgi:outer membrane lipoprotein-sorting protein